MNVEVKRVVQGWSVTVDGVEEACFDDYEKALDEAAWIEEALVKIGLKPGETE